MKNQIKNIMKGSRGITLIALVITIIILLILASVLINLSLGNNGLFTRVKSAKEAYEYAAAKEILEMKLVAIQTECRTTGEEYGLTKIEEGLANDNEVEIVKYYEQVASVSSSAGSMPENIGGIAVKVKKYTKFTFLIGKKTETSSPTIVKVSKAETVPATMNDESFKDLATFEATLASNAGSQGGNGGGQTQPTTYTITYAGIEGATFTSTNPTSYTAETETFTLVNPTKADDASYTYTFAGWTGTGLNGATMNVSIEKGSTGNRTYTATWTQNAKIVAVSYKTATTAVGGLKLITGEVKEVVYNGTQFVAVTEQNTNSGEHFYVIGETTEGKTMLLAKYCLSKTANEQLTSSATYGDYGRRFSYSNYWSSQTSYPLNLQSSEMLTVLNNQSEDEKNGANNAIIKAQAYSSNFGSNVESRLMTYEEANAIVSLTEDNSINTNSLKCVLYGNASYGSGNTQYTMTDYPTQQYLYWWLGSADNTSYVWSVDGNGSQLRDNIYFNSKYGVRPVLEVSKS